MTPAPEGVRSICEREIVRNIWLQVDINHSSNFWGVLCDLREFNNELGRETPLTVRLAVEALLARAEKSYAAHHVFLQTKLRDRL